MLRKMTSFSVQSALAGKVSRVADCFAERKNSIAERNIESKPAWILSDELTSRSMRG